ncbi:prenyltransferase/squalene oxidase repeat-containing protein [[Eubacterium] cellulosolvens]
MRAIIIIMLILILTCISHVSAYPYSNSEQEVNQALEWLRSQQQTNGSIGGFVTSSWAVMAIVASGEDPHNWSNGGDSIIDYLKKNTDSLSSPTDYSRFILSIVAAGEDPRNVNGADFVATLDSSYNNTQFGDPSLLNDDFWAVMALTSAGIDKNDEKIQNAIAFIKTNQNEGDGGWSYGVGVDSDVDSTAAAIMALIFAGESQSSINITNGLEYMKSKQINNGGFDYGWGNSAATDSWAIQAIVAAGQDPTGVDWTKDEKNPIDDLLSFQNQDGSFNDYNALPDSWTTSYSIPALLGKAYPIFMETSTSQVFLRIEDQNSTIWRGWIDIPQSVTIEAYNSNTTYDNIPGNNVLAILDKASEIASFEYQVSDQWYPDVGFYVESIAGHKAEGVYGWLYLINYSSKEVAMDAYEITSSDEILIYWGTIDMQPLKMNIDPTEVAVNDSFTVTVTYFNESNSEWVPLEGATIHLNDEFITDSEGKATIALTESKVYDMYAEKWGETMEEQFIRSDIGQVGVGVPIPEFNQYLPVMLIIIFTTLFIVRKRNSHKSSQYGS